MSNTKNLNRYWKKRFNFLLLLLFAGQIMFFGLLFGQDISVEKLSAKEWSENMAGNPELWLNRGIKVLLKTGMDAPYIPTLLSRNIPPEPDNIYRLQSMLILSLPMSLTRKPNLPPSLKKKYEKLRSNVFSKKNLLLFRKGTFPEIDSIEKLNGNTELVKNAFQILALTTLDGSNFPPSLNEKFLRFVDRGIFYFTVWRDSRRTEADLEKFLADISKTLNPAVQMLTEGGSKYRFSGIDAVLVAELKFLKSFFHFREDLWKKYIHF
jgi:hypothetical protein